MLCSEKIHSLSHPVATQVHIFFLFHGSYELAIWVHVVFTAIVLLILQVASNVSLVQLDGRCSKDSGTPFTPPQERLLRGINQSSICVQWTVSSQGWQIVHSRNVPRQRICLFDASECSEIGKYEAFRNSCWGCRSCVRLVGQDLWAETCRLGGSQRSCRCTSTPALAPAVIHRKTQRRRCRFSASLWWAEGRHPPRGNSLLNMNFFEYLLGILWIWVMKFMFATVQIVTSMVFGDGLVDVVPVAETLNLIQNMPFCWIWRIDLRRNVREKMQGMPWMKHAVVRKVPFSFWALGPQLLGMLQLKWLPIAECRECKTPMMTKPLLSRRSMWSPSFASKAMLVRPCPCCCEIMAKCGWMPRPWLLDDMQTEQCSYVESIEILWNPELHWGPWWHRLTYLEGPRLHLRRQQGGTAFRCTFISCCEGM